MSEEPDNLRVFRALESPITTTQPLIDRTGHGAANAGTGAVTATLPDTDILRALLTITALLADIRKKVDALEYAFRTSHHTP